MYDLILRRLYIVFLVFCALSEAHARKLVGASTEKRVPLLELYSSESCSSCPPADEWISTFVDKPNLWKTFVPIVFHVDYWNHLGWKDGLSSEAMTARQREVAQTWAEASVYTPAVVLDGKEWRQWRNAEVPDQTSSVPYDVSLSIYQNDDGSFVVTGKRKDSGPVVIRMALLGMQLSSKVTNGENSGKLLKHNFVVLDWSKKPAGGKTFEERFEFKPKDIKKLAVVAWIESPSSPKAIQATGGFL